MIVKINLLLIWIIPTIYVGKLISSDLYLYPNPNKTEAVLMQKKEGVNYKPSGEIIWSDTRNKQRFANNDEVKTKSSSNAIIRFRSGNAIKLGENSHIVINTSGDDELSEIITLVEGNITAAVAKTKPKSQTQNQPARKRKISIIADQKSFELDENGSQLNLQKDKGTAPVQIKSLKGKLGIKKVVAPPKKTVKTFGSAKTVKPKPPAAPKISKIKLTEIDSSSITPDVIEKTNLELVASRANIETVGSAENEIEATQPQINTVIEEVTELTGPVELDDVSLSTPSLPSLSLKRDKGDIDPTRSKPTPLATPKKIAIKKQIPKYVIVPATTENAGPGIWVLSEGKVSGKIEGKNLNTSDYIKAMESLRGICVFRGNSNSVVWASKSANYQTSLSDTLGDKKTIYLLVEDTLIPINRRFIEKEKENLKFILEKTYAIFDEKVELLNETIEDF